MREATAPKSALPAVACVGPLSGEPHGRGAGRRNSDPRHFATIEALLAADSLPAAVYIAGVDAATQRQWLSLLRKDARFCLLPVYIDQAHGPMEHSAADGVIASAEACLPAAAPIHDRLQSIARESHTDPELRLLAFLLTRPQRTLAPLCDWQSPLLYRYPLLEALADPEDGRSWLDGLVRRNYLQSAALVDRVRCCPGCHGAQLNYIDVCSHCGSLDIGEQIFLHCYTCGHVAAQEEFSAGDGLGCRKCQSRLRHIGVDYDRALETFHCAACDSRFTDPEVRARCLQCAATHATTALATRRIEAWRLSPSGALTARTGNVGELFALLDELNYAHPAYFERTLDWQIDLRRRHREVTFGVLCIHLSNLRALIASESRVRTAQLLDAFATRLRELVRTTDLVTRTDDEHCWLFLPQTPAAGLATLRGRIAALTDQSEAAGPRLALTVAAFGADELGDGDMPATLLMSELRSRLRQ